MFELHVPFFIPLWRRVLTVGVALGWAGVEFVSGSVGWGLLFAAAGLYAAYGFFVTWDPTAFDTPPDPATVRADGTHDDTGDNS